MKETDEMKSTTITRRIAPILLGGAAIAPFGSALTAHAAAKTQSFTGSTYAGEHGPIQVTIKVKSSKIINVAYANSPEPGRSEFIQSQALPMLKQETLSAQSYRINYISGATETSEAYALSLRSAISKAKSHKALK
jgi:uncharacterized protein with FMN-binding domain